MLSVAGGSSICRRRLSAKRTTYRVAVQGRMAESRFRLRGLSSAIPTQSENEQAEESNHHPEQFSIAAFAKPSPHHFSPQFCGQIVGRDRRDLRPRARPFDGTFSCKCRSASRSDGIRYIAGASVSIIEGSSAMSRNRSDNSRRIIIGRALSHRAGRARSHTFIVQWGSVSADRPRGGG